MVDNITHGNQITNIKQRKLNYFQNPFDSSLTTVIAINALLSDLKIFFTLFNTLINP